MLGASEFRDAEMGPLWDPGPRRNPGGGFQLWPYRGPPRARRNAGHQWASVEPGGGVWDGGKVPYAAAFQGGSGFSLAKKAGFRTTFPSGPNSCEAPEGSGWRIEGTEPSRGYLCVRA